MNDGRNHPVVIRANEPAIAHDPWLRLYLDSVSGPTGTIGKFARIVESGGSAGVAILPILGLRVGLVRQFRIPIGRELWEAPRGFGDTSESVGEAERELREETGLHDATLIGAGSLWANSGLIATPIRCFVARCEADEGGQISDPGEVSEFCWWPEGELWDAIASGLVEDGITLALVAKAVSLGLLKAPHFSAV